MKQYRRLTGGGGGIFSCRSNRWGGGEGMGDWGYILTRGGQISTFIPSIQIFDFYPIGRLPHLHFFFQDRIEGQRLLPSIFCKVGVDGAMFFYIDSVKVDS